MRRAAPRAITSNISSFLAGNTMIEAQIRNPGEISLKSVYKPFYVIYMFILRIIYIILLFLIRINVKFKFFLVVGRVYSK